MSRNKKAHSGRRSWEIEVDDEVSERMSRVRRRDTKPERQVRSILHALGHRYTIDNGDLPGRPDIANRSRGWVVFVHGCYWHRHPGCAKATTPRKNREFWLDKFEANRQRDREAVRALEARGFLTIVVWECELTDSPQLRRRLANQLASKLP